MFNTVYKNNKKRKAGGRFERGPARAQIGRNSPPVEHLRVHPETVHREREGKYLTESAFLTESEVRRLGIKHIATHYEGLVQIKNFGPKGALEREIKLHLTYYPASIFHIKFWIYALITVLLPRKLLLPLSDFFKQYILSNYLRLIKS